ncbi:MAG: hemolysin family protein [Acidobacteriota bacterium]
MIPLWEMLSLVALTAVYFFLALFRAAQLELPRIRLGTVLREAGRPGNLLEHWTDQKRRAILTLGLQVAFQAILVLAGLLVAEMVKALVPEWRAPLRIAVAFLGTVLFLVIMVRFLVVRAIVNLVPESAVRIGGRVAALVAMLLLPLLAPLDRLLRHLLLKLGARSQEKTDSSMEEEIQAFVCMGEEEGILEKEEGDLVRNVVDFGDTIAREIMTPRTEMACLPPTARLAEVREAFIAAKHSRLPVIGDTVDEVVGVLTMKDLLPIWRESPETRVDHLVRPVMFVPETKKISDILREMQRAQVPFAVVVDEYGGTAGLVTVEDIVEEIVGEIQEEHEVAEEKILREASGSWLVSGGTPVDEVARVVGMDAVSADVDTIGGLVSTLMGRVPEVGEEIEHACVKMKIVGANGRRVLKVRLTPIHAPLPMKGKS